MRYPVVSVGNGSLVASLTVSRNACKLVAVVGYSDGTAAFLQIFEQQAPANGTAPKFAFPMDAGRAFAFALPVPVDMDTCFIAASSAVDTYQAVAGNHQSIQALLAG